MTDPDHEISMVASALRGLADQAERARPPKVPFIVGDARLRRRRHRLLAGLSAGATAVAVAIAVPIVVAGHSTGEVLAPVTVAPTCPDERRSTDPPAPATQRGAGGQLVPGRPAAATICWYRLVYPRLVLDRHVVVTGDRLRALTDVLDSTPERGRGDYSCPAAMAGGDSSARVLFAYPGNRGVTVDMELTGCRFTTNGRFTTIPDGGVLDAFRSG